MCNARVIISSCLWLVLAATAGLKVAAETMNFSQAYREHLQMMTSVVDEFFDPCEDFFQHACGNYDSQAAPLAPFLYNQEAAVRFFETSRRNFSTRGGILLNDLYESCKQRKRDVSQWKHVGFLAQFSRWPYLRYQWDEANIEASWPRLTAHLAARGVQVLFEIFFAKNTIYVSPAHITCPASQADIKATIMSPATSVVSEQVGDIISSELLFLCKELTGEWVSSVEVPEATWDTDETHEFFNELFQTLGFTLEEIEQSRKMPVNTSKLGKILAVVRRTETRQVVNFLIWKMIQYLDYDDCFRLAEEFEPLLFSEYWNWGVFKPKIAKDVAFASFLYQTTRYQKRRKDRLASDDWTAFLDKKVVRKKDFNIDRVIKTYAKRNLSPQAIADDYAGVVTLAETYYKNYFGMKSRQLRLSFAHDNFVDKEDTNHPWYLLKKFLNFAIITKRLPLFHYFSTESFELWRNSELFSSTDDLYAAIDCLSRQTDLYLGEYPTFSSLSAEKMDEVLKFYRAFHESFYDYLFWLEGEEFAATEDYELQQFGLTSSRVMFYSVAQLYCGRDDARYATLINRSFMNSMEFQDAFECEIEAPMNPTAKCMCKDC